MIGPSNYLVMAQGLSNVSIIIPCYNAERWLAEAIESCLYQSYDPVEVIVIDDGSTDASVEIANTFGGKTRLVTGPNRGGNHARNRGLRRLSYDSLR